MSGTGVEARVRAICTALPGVTEKASHGSPAFFAGRQFVMLWPDGHHEHRFAHLWCAAPPGAQGQLVEADPTRFFRPPYVGWRGWVGMRLDGDVDWDDVAATCEDAYRTVASRRLLGLLDAAEPGYHAPDVSLVGAEHVRRYRETAGEVGHVWNGVTIILLTTVGRRSGVARTSALIHGRDGDDYLVIASQGGAPTHPNWYLNLTAEPNVEVQDRADRFAAVARTAGPSDKPRLWAIMTALWPNYDVYQRRTDRDIPLVVLTPRR